MTNGDLNAVFSQAGYDRTVLDSLPLPVLVVDEHVNILDFNFPASKLLSANHSMLYRRRGSAVFHCVHSVDDALDGAPDPADEQCVIRQSVKTAFQNHKLDRRQASMEILVADTIKKVNVVVTASPFEYQNRRYALLVLEDVSELLTLRGLLPICMYCKKIRDNQGGWNQIEAYLAKHAAARFTHGICPECFAQFHPQA